MLRDNCIHKVMSFLGLGITAQSLCISSRNQELQGRLLTRGMGWGGGSEALRRAGYRQTEGKHRNYAPNDRVKLALIVVIMMFL